ncbi:MAG: glycogen-binding domain-containing protein [bacterium]|nr:glycogen-binding domain-containing protein [bacterium]
MTVNRMTGSPRLCRALIACLVLATTVLMAAAAGAAVTSGDGGVTFTCRAPAAAAVFVAGDFNGWNATAQPLVRGDDGLWSATVALTPGDHEYKFVVDGAWQEDADNARRKADPFGGSNSLVSVGSDGKPVADAAAAPAAAGTAAPAAAANAPAGKAPAKFTVGPPRAVDGGIQFTYHNPGAARVTLAGSFNGWNADQLPLTNDGKGNWVIIHSLPAGKHEYKFVADGSWFADAENPETQSDPYGGTNSLVTVGADGKLVAAGSVADSSRPASNTPLNPKVYVGGRYLTRFEFAKNLRSDARFRLQRPSQSVDLNFETKISDLTDSSVRLRLDSDEAIIQNNIAAFLDEAALTVHPSNFMMKAYWNQETFTGGDLMRMGGDLDHPGTILHDHLSYGKGSAGVLFAADPAGVHVDAFFANVHNHDFYNDPDLFDNTGEDRVGLRLSRRYGNFELGVPLWAERWLIWMDFGTRVGLPSTGIPVLDEHRANTGDSSTWYEIESHVYNLGLDARYRTGEAWLLGVQGVAIDRKQQFVTGNQYGQNNTNGAMGLPFLDRTQVRFQVEAAWTPHDGLDGRLRHLWDATSGGTGAEREMAISFLAQDVANKQVQYTVLPSPAVATLDSTELALDWRRDDRSVSLWIRRSSLELDYAAIGRDAPADTNLGTHRRDSAWFAGRAGIGLPSDPRGHAELEWGLARIDHGIAGLRDRTLELILRYDRDLTRSTGLIADVRWVHYHREAAGAEDENRDFFAPFLGVRYTPIRKLDLVAAWGVDPIDYSIAYGGRQTGRWWYRQRWLFDNPTATALDAEDQLAKARVVTLRAQLQF